MASQLSSISSQLTQTAVIKASRVPVGHIVCSEKWRGTEIIKPLQAGVSVLYEDNLGVVDFFPSDSMGVVYILEADLVAATSYKNKLVKLRMVNTVKGVVLGERTRMCEQYWTDLQKFVVLELGLVLLPVSGPTEAARFLVQMVHMENRPSTNQLRMKPRGGAVGDSGMLASMQLVPGLGDVKVRALLQTFHGVSEICNASEAELAAVIGKASAVNVKKFFCSAAK